MQTPRTITLILTAAALVAAPAALAMQPAGSGQKLGGSSMARALARRLSRTNNDSQQANKKHPYGLGGSNGTLRDGQPSRGSAGGGRPIARPGARSPQPRRQGRVPGRHRAGGGVRARRRQRQ